MIFVMNFECKSTFKSNGTIFDDMPQGMSEN